MEFFFQFINIKLCQDQCSLQYSDPINTFMMKEGCVCYGNSSASKLLNRLAIWLAFFLDRISVWGTLSLRPLENQWCCVQYVRTHTQWDQSFDYSCQFSVLRPTCNCTHFKTAINIIQDLKLVHHYHVLNCMTSGIQTIWYKKCL